MKNFQQRLSDLTAIARAQSIRRLNLSPAIRPRCNHVAGIWIDNRLVATGFNRHKSHPLQARFSSRPQRIFLHAEIDAIVECLSKYSIQNLTRAEMIVIRMDSEGNLAPSRPCAGCQKALITFNFKDVRWS